METKQAIRKKIYALRKACTDEQVDSWSRELTEKVTALPEFQKADHILAYADYTHEVRTCYLIKEAWKAGKEVAVPKCAGKDLIFRKLTDFSQLKQGYFGIPEPESGETVSWEDALMIMPGVAFDEENHRIGYGGGFYDRYLAAHPDLVRLAVAFEFQRLPAVPVEPTDILPHLVVTEKKVYISHI